MSISRRCRYSNTGRRFPNRDAARHGVALPSVLWALVVIVALGTIFLILMSQSYLSASKHRFEQGAYYCAYGGVMYAKAKLDDDATWNPGGAGEWVDLALGSTVYGRALLVSAPGGGGSLIVTSTGEYGQGGKVLAVRAIQVTISGGEVIEWRNL